MLNLRKNETYVITLLMKFLREEMECLGKKLEETKLE